MFAHFGATFDITYHEGLLAFVSYWNNGIMASGSERSLEYWVLKVEFDRMLSHHEEHEDHEGKTDELDIPSSCPSW